MMGEGIQGLRINSIVMNFVIQEKDCRTIHYQMNRFITPFFYYREDICTALFHVL